MSSTAAQRQAVLRALRHDAGTTTDQLATVLGWKHWDVQPVIVDLAAEGLVRRGDGGWRLPAPPAGVAEASAAVIRQLVANAERRGYELGRRDFQFEPSGDNHHNAKLCPYCSPDVAP